MSQRGAPATDLKPVIRSPWFWVGLVVALLVGLGYGYLHVHLTCVVYTDPLQPSPGMAAFAPYALGFILVPVVIPIVQAVVYWLTLRRTGADGWPGYFMLIGIGVLGVWAGHRFHEWLWAGGETFCG